MTIRWLSVVGVGEDGLDGLSAAGRALIDAAEVLIGGNRHLAMIPADGRERLAWPSPLSALVKRIGGLRGSRVCVLATGDPMCFGIGNTLAANFPMTEMFIIPAPSAFALACARLGWPEHMVDQLTLHGRPLTLLEPFLQPDGRLLLMSEDRTTPGKVAAYLSGCGYGDSRVRVFERMGGPAERSFEAVAALWPHPPGADLNTIAVNLVANAETPLRPRISGLSDAVFVNDGQLTRREIRAVTISSLAPTPHAVLWDVGAGCGSIAIEWMRTDRRCRAYAVETNENRRGMIAQNASALGVPGLEIIAGTAPEALDGLVAPDAIFIGGGLTRQGMLEACVAALRPGGRLVANAVTLEGEAVLSDHQFCLGGSLIRIAISRVRPVGSYRGWDALMPVTQWCYMKPWNSGQ